MSETPTTIKEDGTRWTIENARPRAMRVVIAMVAPLMLAFVGVEMVGDARGGKWVMFAVRLLFALLIALAGVFSLFGSESLALDGTELVWRRGSSQERRCGVAEVEKLERVGNHLRVHVRGQPRPIVIGAGLRQPPPAIAWLTERLQAALIAARTGR